MRKLRTKWDADVCRSVGAVPKIHFGGDTALHVLQPAAETHKPV